MKISFRITRNLFITWIITTIVITGIVVSNAPPRPGQTISSFLLNNLVMIAIICLIIILTGFPAGLFFLKHPESRIKGAIILIIANLTGAAAGNTLCYLLSDFLFIEGYYTSITDHLLDVIIFLIPFFTVAMVILHLGMKRNMVQNELIEFKSKSSGNILANSISLKTGEGQFVINFDKLVYISANGKKTTFHTFERDYTVLSLLKEIQKKLPEERFLRIHRQFIINIKFIQELRYYEGGRYMVYLNDADESILPVGRNITPQLKKIIGM